MFIDGGLADANQLRYFAVLQPLAVVHLKHTAGLRCHFCLDELLILPVLLFLFVATVIIIIFKGKCTPQAFLQFHPLQSVQAFKAYAAPDVGQQPLAFGQNIHRHQPCHHVADGIAGILLVVQQNASPSEQFVVVQAVQFRHYLSSLRHSFLCLFYL